MSDSIQFNKTNNTELVDELSLLKPVGKSSEVNINDSIELKTNEVDTSGIFRYNTSSESVKLNQCHERDNIDLVISHTGCNIQKAQNALNRTGNTVDAILYLIEGDDLFTKYELESQDTRDHNEHVKKINELRVIVDEKDIMYDTVIAKQKQK